MELDVNFRSDRSLRSISVRESKKKSSRNPNKQQGFIACNKSNSPNESESASAMNNIAEQEVARK